MKILVLLSLLMVGNVWALEDSCIKNSLRAGDEIEIDPAYPEAVRFNYSARYQGSLGGAPVVSAKVREEFAGFHCEVKSVELIKVIYLKESKEWQACYEGIVDWSAGADVSGCDISVEQIFPVAPAATVKIRMNFSWDD